MTYIVQLFQSNLPFPTFVTDTDDAGSTLV